PEFFDVELELAVQHQLPIRLPSTVDAGFPLRKLAAEEGVVFPDHFDNTWRAGSRARVRREIAELEPGVTEIHIQPAIDTPEVRALSRDAAGWIDDHALVVDGELTTLLDDAGAIRIGYRDLRRVMREG
ncbi:MAG TPA: hypothetical protein VG478_05460, partial [Acidimicrobiales bacterium]|nr:hypothetical protein [Acidimicrobiales bacterium]